MKRNEIIELLESKDVPVQQDWYNAYLEAVELLKTDTSREEMWKMISEIYKRQDEEVKNHAEDDMAMQFWIFDYTSDIMKIIMKYCKVEDDAEEPIHGQRDH